MMNRTFTAFIERDPESGMYIGSFPAIHGAHTQADTLDELHANLKDVLQLCLEALDEPIADLAEFVGIWQITVD